MFKLALSCFSLFPVQLYAVTAAPGLSFFKQSYVFVRYHRDISNTATPGTLSEHRRWNELETEWSEGLYKKNKECFAWNQHASSALNKMLNLSFCARQTVVIEGLLPFFKILLFPRRSPQTRTSSVTKLWVSLSFSAGVNTSWIAKSKHTAV